MYTKNKSQTNQIIPLIRCNGRYHNLPEELDKTFRFLKTDPPEQFAEKINLLPEMIHNLLPFAEIDVSPGHLSGECLYKISFPQLYDKNIVDEGTSDVVGTVIVFLGSFITYNESIHKEIALCDTKKSDEITHAVLIDGNDDRYDFQSWKTCLDFLFNKYSKMPIEVAKKRTICPK